MFDFKTWIDFKCWLLSLILVIGISVLVTGLIQHIILVYLLGTVLLTMWSILAFKMWK